MMRLSGLLFGLIVYCGCGSPPTGILIQTTPFTDEQKASIAREDAEACNCGREVDTALLDSETD